jgi:hypothetical protein
MKLILILTLVTCFFASGKNNGSSVRLVFEDEKSSRYSFCMYSDGKFYETRGSGCVGQDFSWGYWKKFHDTVRLQYQSSNIFDFDVIKSADSLDRYQIVSIVDCYDQPMRFQIICRDTTCLYPDSTGFVRVEKGRYISYLNHYFGDYLNNEGVQKTNSDTLIFKWRCNRESIESISGGDLFINNKRAAKRFVLRNKRMKWIEN